MALSPKRSLPTALLAMVAVLAALQGTPLAYAAQQEETGAGGPALDLSSWLPEWAQQEILGIAIWQLVAAFILILIGFALKKVSDYIFQDKLLPWVEKTRYQFLNLLASAVSRPCGYLFAVLGLFGAFGVLPLPAEPNLRGFVFGALKVLVAANLLWFLFRVVDIGTAHLARLAERTESKLDDQLVPVIRKSVKATIAVVTFIWVIQLFGYSVSSLIAGLGIGGLAVALALQDTLANFFGSVFIFIDRPFAVGDWIKMGDVEGIVESIGFRSTRVRTWPETLVAVPNKTVAAATIDNWSKMPKRRVVQTIGVTYETVADQMEEAVAGAREIVENDEGVDKEFIVVRFTDFGESSLNILLYYFTQATAFADHLATKERINLAVMRMLDSMGLSIAFPTTTVYFEGQVAKNAVRHLNGTGEGAKR